MRVARLVAFILVLLILSMMFAGCGKKDPAGSTVNTTEDQAETNGGFDFTPESKKIVVWLGSDDTEDPSLVSFAREFPDFTIDNSITVSNPFGTADVTGDFQKLAASIASGTQPDMMICYMHAIQAYYSNLYMPVQEFLEHDPEYSIETHDPNAFIPTTFNGVIYFIPADYTTSVFTYNKDLFENAGLDPDKPPKTWTELSEINKRLVTYDSSGKINSIGLQPLRYDHTYFWNIYAGGEHFTDSSGLKVNLFTDSYVKLVEFMRDLPEAYGGNDKLPGWMSFYGGNYGITTGGAANLSWHANFASFDFSVFRYPKRDDVEEDFVPITCYNYYAIVKQAHNPRGAWKLLRHIMTEGRFLAELSSFESSPTKYITNYIPHIPTRERIHEEFKEVLSEESWELIRIRDEIMQSGNVPLYYFAKQTEFNLYFEKEFTKFMSDKISSTDLLKNAQAFAEATMEEFKQSKIADGWILTDDGTLLPPE
ncbi:MAG: extracellular solute-binding protein [Firmicutes bacterium]|nr:extracellular solute-binding protein [Bacillota bacterium]